MAQIALYRSWRPDNFDSVVSQQQVVLPLRQAVIRNEIGHAYLFCGTRGTGKTSLAKIFARAVNCLHPENGNPCNHCEICQGLLDGSLLDVQEIDAASNNSVENIRRLIDEIVFLPVKARYKVYIIDEVHMLSTGAFNALLKTLEEPPAHALFILATTEPYRLPATIISRCQRFDFRRIPDADICTRLRQIADSERVVVTDDALRAIAAMADGALRDAISLLDQCRLSFPKGTTAAGLLELVGSVNKLFYADMAFALAKGDAALLLEKVAELVAEGRDIARFTSEFAAFFRDVLVCRCAPNNPALVSGNPDELAAMRELGTVYTPDALQRVIGELQKLLSELRFAPQPRISLEITLLHLLDTLSGQALNAATNIHTASAPTKEPFKQETPISTDEPRQEAPFKTPQPEVPQPSDSEQAVAAEPFVTAQPAAPQASAAAEPLAAAHKAVQAEAAAAEQAQTGIVPEASPSLSPDELLEKWQICLEQLARADLYLQLFAKEAVPRPYPDHLGLGFAKSHEAHYNVLTSAAGQTIFKIWAQLWPERRVPLTVEKIAEPGREDARHPDDGEPPTWLERIRQAAAELDITMTEEDE